MEHTVGGYVLGIDCGTTHTAAAVLRSGRAEVLRLGTRRAEVPSLVFVPADGPVLIGEPAERRGQAEPGRLAREFKRRVGDPVPMLVGGAPYSAHAMIARQLEHVLRTAIAHQGGPPDQVVLTCPANWGPYKRELLEQAARLADLPPVQLRTEPEAAAIDYAAGERMGDGDIIAVYDLGGGTFDAAVLRRTADGFDILGTPEGIEQLGGIDFDEAVFDHVVRTLPPERLAEPDVAALARLRRDCVEAKEALSDDTEVLIPVALPQLHTRVRLTRTEFEAMIRPALTETVGAVRRALRSAGVGPDELRTILLSGGSSRIPLVSQLLSTEFDRPVVLDPHPEHSIALGAARSSMRLPRPVHSRPAQPEPAQPGPVQPVSGQPGPAQPEPAPTPVVPGRAAAASHTTPPPSPIAATTAIIRAQPRQRANDLPATTPMPAAPAGTSFTPPPPPVPSRAHGAAPVPPPGHFDPDQTGPHRRLGRRAQIVLAAAAVLVIAGVTAFFVNQRDPDDGLVSGVPTASAAASPSAVASSPPPPTDCGSNETFESAELHPSWELTRPDVDVLIEDSAAKITAPDGSDIYEDRIDAPMLLRTVPGDFVMETTVVAEPDQFYQGAGLVLLVDELHYVRLELGYGDVRAIVLEYRNGGAHTKVHPPHKRDPNVVVAATDGAVLQLERSGNKVTARWRSGNQTKLRNLGSITLDLPDIVKAGAAVLNRAQSGAEPEPFQATIYRVWFTC